jgi:6-pyruvoyl-tetrahydropterin synthase
MRLFVDQLTNIDSSYLDPTRGVVGETWLVDLEIAGDLDDQGMVFDFGHVKKRIKAVIDDVADHRLIVPTTSPAVEGAGGDWTLRLANGSFIEHHGPAQSICALQADSVTAESLREHLLAPVRAVLPANVHELSLHLYHEGIGEQAYYHYSHGLKHHDGNCQRIAHGHRSRIQVWRNEQRDQSLERSIARAWQDIYLVTTEDIVERVDDQLLCQYVSTQGEFSLRLPENLCDILDTDSTVERIAEHLARRLAQQHPNDRIRVRAFEGVNKGAICELASSSRS